MFGCGGIHFEGLVLDRFLLRREEVEPLLDGDPLPRILEGIGVIFDLKLFPLENVRSERY